MSLPHWHARLSDLYHSILAFDVPLSQPPIIGLSPSHDADDRELPGLRFLRDEVKRDCDVLDKFLREHADSSAPSTNAPYLIAVWDELVHARQPLAIYRMFSPADGQDKMTRQERKALKSQTRPVKVDVVAENGARWVRVNTIKNTRLMMEFREMDSYLTSDEDEDELRPRLAQTEFDNSVLRMGRELLAAAKANPVSIPATYSSATTIIPKVTIRLTRLDPLQGDTPDPRIEKTIQCLRDMGIDVELGERSYPCSVPIPKTPPKLEPTTNINLDLSALIALVTDISHSPLPRTEQEAYARFEPPQSYLDWKKDRVKSLARQSQGSLYDVEEGTWENSGQQSRALAAQAIQEMNKGVIEEIHERMSAVVTHPSTNVTFWTTSEARHRCLLIVSKIGGERERQRADALLGSTYCSRTPPVPTPVHIYPNGVARAGGTDEEERKALVDAYWEYSRYPAGILPLVPVRVYPSIIPTVEQSRTTFFDALTRLCTGLLSHEAAPVSQVAVPSAEQAHEEIPRATQTSLPKLTVHTVTSMLAGVSRGYTTLTTNRSSVKVVLKEMKRVYGRGGYERGMGDVEKAAVWVVDPRSLSEGMST